MSEFDETIKEFLLESRENLDQVDRDLVALEASPGDRNLLGRIFRAMHTLKGTCGFLGYGQLERLAHAAENLLALLRDQKLTMNLEIATALLAMVDTVRRILCRIEESGRDDTVDEKDHINLLHYLGNTAPAPTLPLEILSAAPSPPPTPTPSLPETLEPELFVEEECEDGTVSGAATRVGEEASAQPASPEVPASQDSTIRVDVEVLDQLVNLVGELVLARNQILQFNPSHEDLPFLAATQRLNHVTSKLQETVMKTRLQRVDHLWSRLPRLVRDLCRSSGKQVQLVLEGKDTELDKTLIEAIRDPLTHIIRNAIDHGIELPSARQALGKPPRGTLHLRACHEGEQVNIEIHDDGAGVDCEAVLRKALQRGLITPEVALLSDPDEIARLLFLPGFSTRSEVTATSGRGVGMDVVKTNIEAIGGTVDLWSKPNEGTTIRIRIPLTLAIIPALVVREGEHRCAIPQVNLLELVRLEGPAARRGVEILHSVLVHRLRGRLLPLVDLGRELAGISGPCTVEDILHDDSVNIVVLQADDRTFGLVVDAICDTMEIVVKPLGALLRSSTLFAGATILGDGQVALILDVLGLAHKASVITETRQRTRVQALCEASPKKEERMNAILFASRGNGRMAVPLAEVERLEIFPASQLEHAGTQGFVQYRGQMLPLIDVFQFLPERRALPRENPEDRPATLPVVVYKDTHSRFGLVIGEIIDVITAELGVCCNATREGVRFTTIIQGRISEILDVPWVVNAARTRGWFADSGHGAPHEE